MAANKDSAIGDQDAQLFLPFEHCFRFHVAVSALIAVIVIAFVVVVVVVIMYKVKNKLKLIKFLFLSSLAKHGVAIFDLVPFEVCQKSSTNIHAHINIHQHTHLSTHTNREIVLQIWRKLKL